jgi:hypothetical protein
MWPAGPARPTGVAGWRRCRDRRPATRPRPPSPRSRTPRILKRWPTATRNSTSANSTVTRTYLSAVSRALVPSSKVAEAWSLSRFASSSWWLRYWGICAGAGRRGRVGERIGLQPGLEGAAVLGGEAANERRLELRVVGCPGLEPGIEHRGVGHQLLADEGGGGVGGEAVSARLAVQHRLAAVPSGGQVAAPGRGDGGDREDQHLEDLDDLLPAVLGPVGLLLLAQLVSDLDAHPFGMLGLRAGA